MTQPPVIPPRPSRTPQKQDPAPSPPPDIPKIPPRPSRRNDQSQSPMRNNSVSPALNELPDKSNMSGTSSSDAPDRSPSVTAPSPDGGVGSENPGETRMVGADLELHAPKPTLPSSSAEAKVQAMTRTDSHEAAAVNFGTTGWSVHKERSLPRSMEMPAAEPDNKKEVAIDIGAEEGLPHQRNSEDPSAVRGDLHQPEGFPPTSLFRTKSHREEDGGAGDEADLATDEVRSGSAFQPPVASPAVDHRDNIEEAGRGDNLYNETEKHAPLEEEEESKSLLPKDDTEEKTPTEQFVQHAEVISESTPRGDLQESSLSSLRLRENIAASDLSKQEIYDTTTAPTGENNHKPESHEKAPLRPDTTSQELPSRDSYEGASDSQTTLTRTTSQDDSKGPVVAKSPDVPAKPGIPPRPRRLQHAPPIDASGKPTISPTEKRPPPIVPGRPKPQVPVRPAKLPSRGSSDSLTRVTSNESGSGGESTKDTPAVLTKEKPTIPVRPGGSRIAALKAGFLSDLNSRLQVGPQGPKPVPKKKEEEAPKEKVPLSDARKGRARGPARRKPATENVALKLPSAPEVRITGTWNVWQINEDGDLVVGGADKPKQAEPAAPEAPLPTDSSVAPEMVKNLAVESADPKLSLETEGSQQPDNVKSTEPEPSKPDEHAPSEPTESVNASLGSKESPPPTTPLPEEKTLAGLTTEAVAESSIEDPSHTEVSDPKPGWTSSTTRNLHDANEKMAALDEEDRGSGGDMHSPEREPIENVDLSREPEETM